MNLSDIRTKTRKLIRETTASHWSDPNVDAAINNRYFEAQDRLNLIRPGYFDTAALIGLSANVNKYDRPFFKPVRGYYRLSGTEYVQCNVYAYDSIQPDAEGTLSRITPPGTFTVVEIGAFIYVYPTPTATLASGLKVISDYETALAIDTDVPRLKDELHWRLAYGAAAELLADDPTYPEKARDRLESDWLYIFAPEPEAARRLCRIYPERVMGRLTMEPQTPVNVGRRRFLNNGTEILWG